MIAGEDPVVDDPAAFAGLSVAARGLLRARLAALRPGGGADRGGELPLPAAGGDHPRRGGDGGADAGALARSLGGDPDQRRGAGATRSISRRTSRRRALYAALTEALQADIDLRLGRPMGTFERPQPRRAEAWRSGRSLRERRASRCEALRGYAATVFGPATRPRTTRQRRRELRRGAGGGRAGGRADRRGGGDDAGAGAGRGAAERGPAACRTEVAEHVGPAIGVTSGFNSMDGD